jgi:GntR family transcriptional regulator
LVIDVGTVLDQRLDPTSDRAVFRQIADHIRSAIERGRLAEGSRVPSEAQMMEHYGVARMTVRNALKELQTEGLLVSEHGKGVFVRRRPHVKRLASDRFARAHRKRGKAAFLAEAESKGVTASVDRIRIDEMKAPPEIAELLKLAPGEKVVVRSRRYLHDGRPVETAVSYLPADIVRGTPIMEPNPGPGGIYARLEELGFELERFVEDTSARMPTPEESRNLSLAGGIPVLHLVRTAFAKDGRSVEVCDTVMAADAFQLSYELPAR